MFGIGIPELMLILIIGLVVFGPGKLPEIGRMLGKTVSEFRKVTSTIMMDQPTAGYRTVHTATRQEDKQETIVASVESGKQESKKENLKEEIPANVASDKPQSVNISKEL